MARRCIEAEFAQLLDVEELTEFLAQVFLTDSRWSLVRRRRFLRVAGQDEADGIGSEQSIERAEVAGDVHTAHRMIAAAIKEEREFVLDAWRVEDVAHQEAHGHA